MDSKHQIIECAAFLSLRLHKQAPLCNQIESIFLKMAKSSLRAYPFKFDEKFLDIAATDMIINGSRIFENVDECDEDEERIKRKKSDKVKLYRLSDRYRNMKEEAILVLRMRSLEEIVDQCDATPYTSKYPESFGRVFPNLNKSAPGIAVSLADIHDYESLKHNVSDFTANTASKAMRLVIVLNKPIEQDRLVISDSRSVPFQSFLDYVISCFTENLNQQILPFEVDIAYVQKTMPGTYPKATSDNVQVLNICSARNKTGFSLTYYDVITNVKDSFNEHRYCTGSSKHENSMFQMKKYGAQVQSAGHSMERHQSLFQPTLDSQSVSTELFSSQESQPVLTSTWSAEELSYDTTD